DLVFLTTNLGREPGRRQAERLYLRLVDDDATTFRHGTHGVFGITGRTNLPRDNHVLLASKVVCDDGSHDDTTTGQTEHERLRSSIGVQQSRELAASRGPIAK